MTQQLPDYWKVWNEYWYYLKDHFYQPLYLFFQPLYFTSSSKGRTLMFSLNLTCCRCGCPCPSSSCTASWNAPWHAGQSPLLPSECLHWWPAPRTHHCQWSAGSHRKYHRQDRIPGCSSLPLSCPDHRRWQQQYWKIEIVHVNFLNECWHLVWGHLILVSIQYL